MAYLCIVLHNIWSLVNIMQACAVQDKMYSVLRCVVTVYFDGMDSYACQTRGRSRGTMHVQLVVPDHKH